MKRQKKYKCAIVGHKCSTKRHIPKGIDLIINNSSYGNTLCTTHFQMLESILTSHKHQCQGTIRIKFKTQKEYELELINPYQQPASINEDTFGDSSEAGMASCENENSQQSNLNNLTNSQFSKIKCFQCGRSKGTTFSLVSSYFSHLKLCFPQIYIGSQEDYVGKRICAKHSLQAQRFTKKLALEEADTIKTDIASNESMSDTAADT
jgi:hypothetical protein